MSYPADAGAQIVLHAQHIEATVNFFKERVGLQLDTIFPADDPRVAIMSGLGLCVRFDQAAPLGPSEIRLSGAGFARLHGVVAPNGTRLVCEPADVLNMAELVPKLVVSKFAGDQVWVEGRAGMRYRDLLPCRYGGRFIASHIHIPTGGPVPDYVHFHRIHFQMIYCYKGWVRVVYEDQGPPFVMNAGDCVLQPPQIRHRVLECSDDLQVVEMGCPAEHATCVEHSLTLPTVQHTPERDFGGQRFVRHVAEQAVWQTDRSGFEVRDTGIGAASGQVADVRAWRARRPGAAIRGCGDADIFGGFVLTGSTALHAQDRTEPLAAGDAFFIPPNAEFSLTECSGDFEVLTVAVPGNAALQLE